MKHRFICVSSVLINWCWMWSVAFLMTCLRNGNGCSPQKSDIFIMITTTVLWYLGFQMNLYFILSFSFFSVMSRQSQPTDWPTLFVVTLVPGTFSLRKWFEDTRLEGNLARGGGGGGYSLVFLVGMSIPVLHILNLFQTKYALFHTHFQTGSQNTEYW